MSSVSAPSATVASSVPTTGIVPPTPTLALAVLPACRESITATTCSGR